MNHTFVNALVRLIVTLLLLAESPGCTFDPAGAPTDERIDAATQVDGRPSSNADSGVVKLRRKQITIDSSRVEAPQPGFLADFPVLFSVLDQDIAARASTDGRDIYFVDANDVSRLHHEIEKWTPETGELIAWVKIPRLSSSEDTVFYIYYGDPEAAGQASPQEVWSNGYVGVWHLAENPEPTLPGGIRDTTTGNNGTAHATMRMEDLVEGQIGDAIDFDGMDDEITFDNPITGTTPHTISVWVNQKMTNSHDAMVVLGNGAGNQARWFHSAWFDGTVGVGFYGNDWNTGIDIRNDGWKLLHWTYDGTQNRVYVDGVLRAGPMMALPGVATQGSEGRIGNARSPAFGAMMNLDGQLDEVRIATVPHSPEWIQTEYNNQFDPSSFYTVGAEEP